MLDLRSPLILGAAPAGLALAALAWFVVRAGSGADLDNLDARLAQIKSPAVRGLVVQADPSAALAATPLFALTTGPGAAQDVTVQLQGLAITPRRKAALVAIGGKPADWLDLGATRDGVTLMAIRANQIEVDTAIAFKTVGLWDAGSASGGGAPSAGAPASAPAAMPPGVRLPPPPASAPARGG
ncbi:MAG: hypothetical protein P4L73_05225 [Caulobacteraceae bacterium]|nr:hypothetical protein [Caulobacteraceae bacterium]